MTTPAQLALPPWTLLEERLFEAVGVGDAAQAADLLEQGANPRARRPLTKQAWSLDLAMLQTNTALRLASAQGFLECVQLLAPLECPPIDDGLASPIQLASAHGHADCLRELARHDPEGLARCRFPYGPPPALLAARSGHAHALRALLELGCPPELPAGLLATPEFEPPLALAASRGHVECVNVLLEFGANPEARGHQGDRPIDQATLQSQARCVEVLAGVSDLLAGNSQGDQPLTVALRQSSSEVLALLCPSLADALDPDKDAFVASARALLKVFPKDSRREPGRLFLAQALERVDDARAIASCAAGASPARAPKRM
jgi:hypothetical protein